MARKLAWLRPGGHAAAALATLWSPMARAAAPVPPTQIGVNISNRSRSFANLALGAVWTMRAKGGPWEEVPPEYLDANGELARLPDGTEVMRKLMMADTGPRAASFRCTYAGKGTITVRGAVSAVSARPGLVQFEFASQWDHPRALWLSVKQLDPADPIHDVDCREATMPAELRYDPTFVASLRGFKVLRFMDWQNSNANLPVSWATRHTPRSIGIRSGDGASIEDMVALAKQVGADPWFTIPWNGDAEYVARFAKLVHDTLPAGRKVYVELGNEVWNYGFRVAHQALEESDARRIAPDRNVGRTYRYAQRMTEVMEIWEKAFADDPARLVRVAATQHRSSRLADLILGYGQTARHVDALATAPYFGFELAKEGAGADLDATFARLGQLLDATIDKAEQHKAVARKYGKRYIAYEAGQHIVLKDDLALAAKIQRDPRMYDLYKRYIASWRSRIGDVLALYSSTGAINRYGAWGLAERPGQPAAEAPKLRAVAEELDR